MGKTYLHVASNCGIIIFSGAKKDDNFFCEIVILFF